MPPTATLLLIMDACACLNARRQGMARREEPRVKGKTVFRQD